MRRIYGLTVHHLTVSQSESLIARRLIERRVDPNAQTQNTWKSLTLLLNTERWISTHVTLVD